jgi:signal transduction histidine kinase
MHENYQESKNSKYSKMDKHITDEELLAELKRRFDDNAANLEQERKLIAELNTVNDKLLASEDLKSNFLSNIRNEINNPIASILELSKNIYEGQLDVDTMKAFATLIFSEAFDLDFQLRNIFLSAEIEAGESPLSVISVNISSLIDTVITAFKSKIEKRGLQFTWKNEIDQETIFKTDSEKLHLILSNLIANAIQFNKSQGSIEVESKILDGQLVISIEDSGIGISEENQSKIYDRFHQIEEGSTKSYGGHGLGLSITKALLEIIEGTIRLESELGKGSKFILTINQLESFEGGEDTFSSDGNDFLFDQDEDDMLF